MKQKQALWEKKKRSIIVHCATALSPLSNSTRDLWLKGSSLSRVTDGGLKVIETTFFFFLFLLQLSDSSKGKEGNPCPLNHGRRLEKEGQLKVSKDESVWNYLCKGGEQGKSQNGLEGFFLAYGKILTIAGNPLLKYYLMSEFQNRFWHSPVCQKHPGCSC